MNIELTLSLASHNSFCYQSAPKDDEEELRLALIRLTKAYGR